MRLGKLPGAGACSGLRLEAPEGQAALVMRALHPSPQVAEILGAILVQLPTVDHLEVRGLLIEGILRLAHYHQETVLTALLRQPLPMERWVPRVGGHGPLCNSGLARFTFSDTSERTGP